jgi:hypothetical protein
MAAQAPHLPSQQNSPLLHDFAPHEGAAESTVATDASPASTLLLPPWFVADGNGFEEASSPPQAASTSTNPKTTVRIVPPSV